MCQNRGWVSQQGLHAVRADLPPENRSGEGGMWRWRNTLWCVCAAVLAAATPLARAQPTVADALATFANGEAWVRGGGDAVRTPDGAAGVEATLRLGGRVAGRSSAWGDDACARALRGALDDARDGLGERFDPARLSLSLDLAAPLVPLRDDAVEREVASLSPGLDGVAVRVGERVEAVFPGAMLTTGAAPGAALVSLFVRISGDTGDALRPVAELRDRHKGGLYRFRSLLLAQPGPGEPPTPLVRGGRLITEGGMTAGEIVRTCDGIAQNLMERRPPDPESLALPGTYRAVADRYDPPETGLRECMVAAYALLRYASTPGVDGLTAVDARVRALELLRHAADRTTEFERDPVVASFALLAACEGLGEVGGEGGVLPVLIASCRAPLQRAYDGGGFDADLAPASYGAVALGLVALGETTGELSDIARAEGAVNQAYASAGVEGLVGQMPWLGLADVRLAALSGDEPRGGAALREMRRLVWDHQVGPGAEEADLVGGILLGGTRPDWQTLRPAAFVAAMLGEESLTRPDERLDEVAHLVRTARFVRQLCADDSSLLYTNPQRSAWGVREAVWSPDMPPDAASLALLTMSELSRSFCSITTQESGK